MDTFVVRVHRSRHGTRSDDDHLRGIVEEISTGFQATFNGTHELLSILRRQGHAPAGVSPRPAETQ